MERRVEVDGGTLVADVDGHGPPVVLVHAGVCDARQWAGVAERLADRFTVVRYDRRGYGRSPATAAGPVSSSRDLVALLDGLGLDEVTACGNSFGGFVVLEAAALAPERFGRLVLLAPLDPAWEDWSAEMDAYEAAEEAALEAGDVERAIALNLDFWVRRPQDRDTVATMLRDHYAAGPVEETELDPPLGERLDAILGPVRVLVGEHDHREFRGMAHGLAARLAGGPPEVVAGAGHLVPLERPDAVVAALEA
jgi:pimeloyl-ACP methyl ester carboxylesterase